MKGLYQELADMRARLALARETMRMDASPQDAHDAGLEAEKLARSITSLEALIEGDELLLAHCEALLLRLRDPALVTAHRMLACRHVEDAESRILRELGDLPETRYQKPETRE